MRYCGALRQRRLAASAAGERPWPRSIAPVHPASRQSPRHARQLATSAPGCAARARGSARAVRPSRHHARPGPRLQGSGREPSVLEEMIAGSGLRQHETRQARDKRARLHAPGIDISQEAPCERGRPGKPVRPARDRVLDPCPREGGALSVLQERNALSASVKRNANTKSPASEEAGR